MKFRWLALLFLAVVPCFGDIVDDVRGALAQKEFSVAEQELQQYRTHHEADPAYLEALSWMARASFAAGQLNPAESYAKQTEAQVLHLLQQRGLDDDEHLPIALGAAIEVQAQVLQARNQRAEAVALLRRSLTTYGKTSIAARLQKNLNLLTLAGQPAPALAAPDFLGPKPPTMAQLKGSPVLLFFWAHWCIDCKAEGPIITRLRSEFGSQGLTVIAPTKLYGYAARGEDATPAAERAYIQRVWQQFYPGLQSVPVPVSKQNFTSYGASTTPTLVLIDRKGHVSLYHPGVLSYDELHSDIEKALAGSTSAGGD